MCTRKNSNSAALLKGLELDQHARVQESLIVFSVVCTEKREKGRVSAFLNFGTVPPREPMKVDLRKHDSISRPSFDARYGLRSNEQHLINSRLVIGQDGRCGYGA